MNASTDTKRGRYKKTYIDKEADFVFSWMCYCHNNGTDITLPAIRKEFPYYDTHEYHVIMDFIKGMKLIEFSWLNKKIRRYEEFIFTKITKYGFEYYKKLNKVA